MYACSAELSDRSRLILHNETISSRQVIFHHVRITFNKTLEPRIRSTTQQIILRSLGTSSYLELKIYTGSVNLNVYVISA
jgi:hypothetical protein